MKERRLASSLGAVQRQIVDLNPQAPGVQMEAADFSARSRTAFNPADDGITKPFLRDSGLKNDEHNQHERRSQSQHAACPSLPAHLHVRSPSDTISIFSCPRASSSHCVARSLIARRT